jgi:predicted secreted protein
MEHEVDETGGEVSVRAGDRIRVTVAENASTGHVWTPSAIPDGVVLADSTRDLPSDAAPGQAGTRVFVFDVTGPVANGELRIDLKREWEPEYATSLSVRITPATEPAGPVSSTDTAGSAE